MTIDQMHRTRRDRRHHLRPGCATAEFADPQAQARIVLSIPLISRVGVALLWNRPSPPPVLGSTLGESVIRIGDCVLEGDLVVRSLGESRGAGMEVGCHFYPGGRECEQKLMALIAGIEAAQGN